MFMKGQTSVNSAVGLAKALSPVFVIRGAHLSITQRLPSQHIIEIHKTLISWGLGEKNVNGDEGLESLRVEEGNDQTHSLSLMRELKGTYHALYAVRRVRLTAGHKVGELLHEIVALPAKRFDCFLLRSSAAGGRGHAL